MLVELCPARAKRLMALRSEAGTQLSVLAKLQRLVEAPGTVRGKLLGLAMRSFLAPERKAGLESGMEFEVALQEAAALNAHVIHGDRDISTTMTRLAGTLSLVGILRVVASPPMLPPALQRPRRQASRRGPAMRRAAARRAATRAVTLASSAAAARRRSASSRGSAAPPLVAIMCVRRSSSCGFSELNTAWPVRVVDIPLTGRVSASGGTA